MQISRLIACVIAATAGIHAQPFPNFTPPTPLFRAVLNGDTAELKHLLDAGADPNEARFVGAPPLVVALMQSNFDAAQALIEKGADVKAADAAGSTTLMWAAAAETSNPSIIEELLRRGVDINAANKAGDTALVWAMRRGYTPVVELLKHRGASDRKLVQDSVERAIALLQKSGPEFVKVSGCSSCHHQSLPQMAYALARERGLQIDQMLWDKQAKGVVGIFKPYREQMLQGKDGIPDPAISVSYLLIGLAASGYKPDETTEAMAFVVANQQRPDGSFRAFTARPPIESSGISAAALSLRALQFYGSNPEPKVAKASEWLRTVSARTTEERVMKLLGLTWAKAPTEAIRAAAQALIADQRPDGGWAQLPTLETDAYATGQALFALHEAGQITVKDEVYGRGAAFLLRTQRPDGSWLVRSRSFPFQPYKESGFPHGKDQWISASGTSWASMALTLSLPVQQQVSELLSEIKD
jgi:hypothetical protein